MSGTDSGPHLDTGDEDPLPGWIDAGLALRLPQRREDQVELLAGDVVIPAGMSLTTLKQRR